MTFCLKLNSQKNAKNNLTAEFVNEKILRVFSFGSPPVALPTNGLLLNDEVLQDCPILKSLNIQPDKVYGYVQPWVSDRNIFSLIKLSKIC